MNNINLYASAISTQMTDTHIIERVNEKYLRIALTNLYVLEHGHRINENAETIEEGLSKLFHKFGLHASKSDGLIDYAISIMKGTGKILMYALKGDKEKIKQEAEKLTKAKFLDFLFKLDQATLHVITGPIHLIDAVTGWHIWPEIKSVATDAFKEMQKLVVQLKKHAQKVFAKHPGKMKHIDRLEKTITLRQK